MVKTDYSNLVNRFTRNINAVISTKNISKMEFLNDINELKSKDLTQKAFISKYNDLFNGVYSFFGKKYHNTTQFEKQAINSFLGSYRRNINPNYYNQSISKDVVNFNRDMRFTTTEKRKIDDKIKKTFNQTKHSRKIETSKQQYREILGYKGFARKEVSFLKQVWNLNKIIDNNLFGYQEIQFRLNYDVIDSNNNIVQSNIWTTIRSNLSSKSIGKRLLEQYDIAYNRVLEFIAKLEQSKLFIKLKLVCTYVFRFGN